jgi:hypothetical protein
MNAHQSYSKYWNMARHYNVLMACEHIAAYFANQIGVVSRKGSTYYTNKEQ